MLDRGGWWYLQCETSLDVHLFDQVGRRPSNGSPPPVFWRRVSDSAGSWSFREWFATPAARITGFLILSCDDNELNNKLNRTYCRLSRWWRRYFLSVRFLGYCDLLKARDCFYRPLGFTRDKILTQLAQVIPNKYFTGLFCLGIWFLLVHLGFFSFYGQGCSVGGCYRISLWVISTNFRDIL